MKKSLLPILACCALSVTTLTSCTSAEKDPTKSFDEIVDSTKKVDLHELGTTMDKAYMSNKGVEMNGNLEITSLKDVISLLPFSQTSTTAPTTLLEALLASIDTIKLDVSFSTKTAMNEDNTIDAYLNVNLSGSISLVESYFGTPVDATVKLNASVYALQETASIYYSGTGSIKLKYDTNKISGTKEVALKTLVSSVESIVNQSIRFEITPESEVEGFFDFLSFLVAPTQHYNEQQGDTSSTPVNESYFESLLTVFTVSDEEDKIPYAKIGVAANDNVVFEMSLKDIIGDKTDVDESLRAVIDNETGFITFMSFYSPDNYVAKADIKYGETSVKLDNADKYKLVDLDELFSSLG